MKTPSIIRSFTQNILFSLLKVSILLIGFLAFSLLALYSQHLSDIDDFQKNKGSMFRIISEKKNQFGEHDQSPYVANGIGKAVKAEIPEVLEYCRLKRHRGNLESEMHSLSQGIFLYADDSFSKIFSFKVLQGNLDWGLQKPWDVVLTESVAKRHFGDQDPINKTLTLNEFTHLNVTCVIEDIPPNSHISFDFLISYASRIQSRRGDYDSWTEGINLTYILLDERAQPQQVEDKINSLKSKYFDKATDEQISFRLQDPTLSSSSFDFDPSFNAKALLYPIAFGTLLACWLNFAIFSIAVNLKRNKEIAVKRILGVSNMGLIKQFAMETIVVVVFSVAGAFLIFILLSDYLNSLLEVDFSSLANKHFETMGFILTLLTIGSILSALFPVLFLGKIKTMDLLKGKLVNLHPISKSRMSLVLVQFVISLILVVFTFVMYNQISFIKNKSLGYQTDDVMVIYMPISHIHNYPRQLESFKNSLLSLPEVSDFTITSALPGNEIRNWKTITGGVEFKEKNNDGSFYLIEADENFANLFELTFLSGRNFLTHSGVNEILITKSGASLLGYANYRDLVNEEIVFDEQSYAIVGVVDDLNYRSLKYGYYPLLIRNSRPQYAHYYVKISSSDGLIPKIKKIWDDAYSPNPIEYFFLDEYLEKNYKGEMQMFGMLLGSSAIVIVLSLIGIFSLTYYNIQTVIKEIVVRKIFGANNFSLSIFLYRKYVVILILSSLVSIPVSHYLCSIWLQTFVFRIHLGISHFTIPIAFIVSIVILLIGHSLLKVVFYNPVRFLRQQE